MVFSKLLGGLGTLAVLAFVVGSLAGLPAALTFAPGATGSFAVVVVVAAAVVGLGVVGRRNAGADGGPYW